MKAVLFNYTGNRDNWGCQATSRSLLRILRNRYPDAEWSVFELDPISPWAKWFMWLFTPLLSLILQKCNPRNISKWQQAFVLFIGICLYGVRVRDIQHADIAILQGEGTMGRYCGRIVRLFFGPFLARACGVSKVVSTNQTVFSKERRHDNLIQNVFDEMDFIAVREPASLNFLKQMGIHKAIFAPDTAFLTEWSPTNKIDHILDNYGVPREFVAVAASASDISVTTMIHVVKLLQNKTALPVVFLASTQPDREIAQAVAAETGVYVLRHPDLDYQDVCGVLRRAELFVSGRFHMCVLAARAATPMVMLATNTHKNEGLRQMLEWPFPVIDASNNTQELSSQVSEVWQNRTVLRSHLKRIVHLLQPACMQAIDWD